MTMSCLKHTWHMSCVVAPVFCRNMHREDCMEGEDFACKMEGQLHLQDTGRA
jgi:hypothetical protein